jgi:hypothetical protein
MGRTDKKLFFREIVQASFDKIFAGVEESTPSEAFLTQELDERLRKIRDLHLLNNVSYDFEKSKAFIVHQQAQNLLKGFARAKQEHRVWIAAGILYYTRFDDGINDNDYFFGLEDDSSVLHEIEKIVSKKSF